MMTIHIAKASRQWWKNGQTKILPRITLISASCSSFLINGVYARDLSVYGYSNRLEDLKFRYKCMRPKQKPKNKGQLFSCASMNEDYRSSRNIAISLFRRYQTVVDRGGAENLKVLFY